VHFLIKKRRRQNENKEKEILPKNLMKFDCVMLEMKLALGQRWNWGLIGKMISTRIGNSYPILG
jgi:hypothetical protein